MARDARMCISSHPASHNLSRLVDTLPFVCNSVTSNASPAVVRSCDLNRTYSIRGFDQHPCYPVNSFMSFCESLATDTLQQGLKEGLDRVIDSNFLKVKIPKPPRRQSLQSGNSASRFEPVDFNVNLSITEECNASCNGEFLLEIGEKTNPGEHCSAGTSRDVEFVALDVQALEQMKAPCHSLVYDFCELQKAILMEVPTTRQAKDIVRSVTDFDITSMNRGDKSLRRPGYDPCSIYDITEFPLETNNTCEPLIGAIGTMRSISASGHLSSCNAPQVPPEMVSFLEEPLLLVGPKLEWEGYVKARKISNEKRRKRRQQQMTPQEFNKMTRVVIGYTLAFFLLVIVTFYIIYFV